MRRYSRLTVKRKAVAGYTAIPPSAAGGGGASTWLSAMKAVAQAAYPTLNSDPFFSDFAQGTTGDYAVVFQSGHGGVNVSGAFRGGVVEIDTGSTTVSGDKAGVSVKGTPTFTPNMLTGAPWFIAARAETVTGVDATGQAFPICMALSPTGTPEPPFLGCYGPTSTTNYVFYVSATTQIDTGIAIVTSSFADFGIGFDGTTLVPYYGNVMAGTFIAIAGKSSTDLTGLQSSAGGPVAIVVAGAGAVRTRIEQDKLFGMCAVP